MSDDTLSNDRKKRKSAPKQSTGCITCKSVARSQSLIQLLSDGHHRIRHVKCDEHKPACLRCMRIGRQCDGYSIDGRRPRHDPIQIVHWQPNTLALTRISTGIPGSRKELRAFDFFRNESTTEFAGFFDSSFWSRSVLQASHAESCIRHAVFALGSLHETVLRNSSLPSKPDASSDPFALQQCNKAIGFLNQSISSNTHPSIEMLLMSCAIFICFASLQGNYESALCHMQSGLRIFRRWQERLGEPSNAKAAVSPGRNQTVDSEIVQIFCRLNIQTLLFIDTHLFSKDFMTQGSIQQIHPVRPSFRNLHEAKDFLDNYISNKLSAGVATYLRHQSCDNDLYDQDCVIIDEHPFSDWSAAFHAFLKESGPALNAKDVQRAKMLEIQYKCAEVLLSVGVPPREQALDAFMEVFETVVRLAAEIIGLREESGRRSQFSFETGVLPALYFVSTRCRNPRIRRQALSLFSSASHQEGVWNSAMLSKIAERIILIEEDRDHMEHSDETDDIAVSSRLTVLNVNIHSETKQVLIACSQQGPSADEEPCLLEQWVTY